MFFFETFSSLLMGKEAPTGISQHIQMSRKLQYSYISPSCWDKSLNSLTALKRQRLLGQACYVHL